MKRCRPSCSLPGHLAGHHSRGERFGRRTPASPNSCTPRPPSSMRFIVGSRQRRRAERACRRLPLPPPVLEFPPKISNLPPKLGGFPPEAKSIMGHASLPVVVRANQRSPRHQRRKGPPSWHFLPKVMKSICPGDACRTSTNACPSVLCGGRRLGGLSALLPLTSRDGGVDGGRGATGAPGLPGCRCPFCSHHDSTGGSIYAAAGTPTNGRHLWPTIGHATPMPQK
uniref:Uncharacterized protein LOC116944683 isoform X2 n=1 Tax=Petromyzon marinus TaxID=7757 RepID=A0AAJ7WY42_PETMA|nr:uncharacterized protein LOC116944683 isoform X2 [Petromyzon marinus]